MSANTDPPDDVQAATTPTPDLEKDLIFEILKNPRRRRVLQNIHDVGTVPLGDLAEMIAAEENDTTVEALSADERKRVYIGLYQTHLPKMDDAGVVDYDQDEGTVGPGPAIDQLYPYLETADETVADDDLRLSTIDLSTVGEPVTLPAWAFLAALLVVGLVTALATVVPGPVWAGVLVVAAVLLTVFVRWT